MDLPPIFAGLEPQEREYFIYLAKEHGRELFLHQNPGKLWDKDAEGKDWSNVTEHCIMEAARVKALGEMLGLPQDILRKLVSAATLHDFNKKEEIRRTREEMASGKSGREGVIAMENENERILKSAGFPEIIISIARHVTGDPEDVYYIKDILDSSPILPEGLAHMVMHYVDNYTRGSSWAEPAALESGKLINDIDRRNAMNAANPNYQKMNQEGRELNAVHPFFKGMTRFEAATALNHLIEEKFAGIIKENKIDIPSPFHIPELVDVRIKEEIKNAA